LEAANPIFCSSFLMRKGSLLCIFTPIIWGAVIKKDYLKVAKGLQVKILQTARQMLGSTCIVLGDLITE